MSLPTVTLAKADTAFTNKVYATFTPDGGGTAIDLVADMLDYDGSTEIKELEFPGDDGIIRPIRRDQTKASESVTLKVYDLKKVSDILGGGFNGFKYGTLLLWITDPTDAATKVRYKTDAFPCTVQRDGQVKFGGQDYTSAQLKFTSIKTSAITWTKDATA